MVKHVTIDSSDQLLKNEVKKLNENYSKWYGSISKSIQEKGLIIDSIGINDIIWNFSDIMLVIDQLRDEKRIILGGDIYSSNPEIEMTYDSWATNTKDYKAAAKKTKKYIERYIKRNGNNYYFSLVVQEK